MCPFASCLCPRSLTSHLVCALSSILPHSRPSRTTPRQNIRQQTLQRVEQPDQAPHKLECLRQASPLASHGMGPIVGTEVSQSVLPRGTIATSVAPACPTMSAGQATRGG